MARMGLKTLAVALLASVCVAQTEIDVSASRCSARVDVLTSARFGAAIAAVQRERARRVGVRDVHAVRRAREELQVRNVWKDDSSCDNQGWRGLPGK